MRHHRRRLSTIAAGSGEARSCRRERRQPARGARTTSAVDRRRDGRHPERRECDVALSDGVGGQLGLSVGLEDVGHERRHAELRRALEPVELGDRGEVGGGQVRGRQADEGGVARLGEGLPERRDRRVALGVVERLTVDVSVDGQLAGDDGLRPLRNSADEVSTLNVEPGGYAPSSAVS